MSLMRRLRAAFRAFRRGDPADHRRSPIAAVSKADVAEFRRFFPREKFFILGHARSGTTLLMRLVRLHPEVHCDYQAHFFTRRPLLKALVDTPEVEEWLRRRSNRWNRGSDLSPIILRAAAEYIMERDAARLGKDIVGDKSPSSTIHGQAVRDLHDVFPDARLIYIVRDGRDVAVSERFRNFVEESRFLGAEDRRILAGLRNAPGAYGAGKSSIFTEKALRRIATGWNKNVGEVDEEARRCFGRKYLAVRYEELLADPHKVAVRVWRFLDVHSVPTKLVGLVRAEMHSNPDEEWQQRRGNEVAPFLSKGKAGNWRTVFTERDRTVFKQLAGETLIKWRYERGQEW